MSYTKAIPRRTPLALALLALAAGVLWIAGASGAQAGGTPGSLAMDPDPASIGVGGSAVVDLVATPPSADLSIWIVEVAFDTDVVEVDETAQGVNCAGATLPASGVGASTCLGKDTNTDTVVDTVVALGGYVRKDGTTARGLEVETVLASITFNAVGAAGECSDLTITATSWVGPDSSEPTPTVTTGEICVASGTTRLFGDLDCDGEISSRDNQALLRNVLSQAALSQTEPCPDIGSSVSVS